MHAGFLQHVFTLKVDKASDRLETVGNIHSH